MNTVKTYALKESLAKTEILNQYLEIMDNEKDSISKFVMRDTEETIKNYYNIDQVSKALPWGSLFIL